LRLVEINGASAAIAHRAGSTAGIALKAWSELIDPEVPSFGRCHLVKLIKLLFVACINFNLILMNKCLDFSKVTEFHQFASGSNPENKKIIVIYLEFGS
jgi:hypothetical protein